MENKKSNTAVAYGLLNGGIAVLLTLIFYLGGVKWFVHPVAYIGYVIPIVIAVMGGLKQRKINGGYLEFAEALKTVFIIFVIGTLISTVFIYVLLNLIDVPFRQALMQESAVAMEKMMERFGASQDEIDKAAANMMDENNYSPGKILLGFALSAIGWFIVSLIIAAIIKRKKPVFENSFNQ